MIRAREGDIDAQHQIVYHYQYLVANVASKYKVCTLRRLNNKETYLTHDDLVSAGLLGLYEAMRSHKDEWSLKYTYCNIVRRVKNHINIFLIISHRKSRFAYMYFYQMNKYKNELEESNSADEFRRKSNLGRKRATNLYELYKLESRDFENRAKENSSYNNDDFTGYEYTHECDPLDIIIDKELNQIAKELIDNNELLNWRYREELTFAEMGNRENATKQCMHRKVVELEKNLAKSLKESLDNGQS